MPVLPLCEDCVWIIRAHNRPEDGLLSRPVVVTVAPKPPIIKGAGCGLRNDDRVLNM